MVEGFHAKTTETFDVIRPWEGVVAPGALGRILGRLGDLFRSVGGVWQRGCLWGCLPPNENQRSSFSNQLFTLSGTTLLKRLL
jgi:hypothetical protein